MNAITRVVAAACLLTGFTNAQTLPSPTSISVQGTFNNPIGESIGSVFIIDDQLDDGYAEGSDLYLAPDTLLPTAPRGNAFFQWGTPASPDDHSSALWFQSLYSGSVVPETAFNVGYLYYRNGTTTSGSGITGFDLQLALAKPGISLPNNLNPTYTSFGASVINSADNGNVAESADSLILNDTYFATNFKDSEGNPYYFKIAFANATGGGSLQTPTAFSVNEGSAGRVTVTGVFTTVPEPSAAVLGAIGSLMLFRRRRIG